MNKYTNDHHPFNAAAHTQPGTDTNSGMSARPDPPTRYILRKRNLRLGLLVVGYFGCMLAVACIPYTKAGYAELQRLVAGLIMLDTLVMGILIHQSAKRDLMQV